MSCAGKVVVVCLISAVAPLWLQEVSGAWVSDLLKTTRKPDFREGEQNVSGIHSDQGKSAYPLEKSGNYNGNIFGGAHDIQIGNVYAGNSTGTNHYGSLFISRNNTFKGTKGNPLFAVTSVQIGNVYPKNVGKDDTFGPVIIESGNTYSNNNGVNPTIRVVLNQTNNTYPKALEGNEAALNPVIIQEGNGDGKTKSAIETNINRNGNNYHPSQYQDNNRVTDLHGHRNTNIDHKIPSLGMIKRRHEELKRKIDYHIRNYETTSKRCSNGILNLKRLDKIVSLRYEVENEIKLFHALSQIDRNRKILCDLIPTRCAKHDQVRKWISGMKLIGWEKTKKSRQLWDHLRTCSNII